jgi:fatty-acyl-CoA synthase
VRIVAALPLTATGKITKSTIKKDRWSCSDPVVWRPDRTSTDYRFLTAEDLTAFEEAFEAHGRSALLGS